MSSSTKESSSDERGASIRKGFKKMERAFSMVVEAFIFLDEHMRALENKVHELEAKLVTGKGTNIQADSTTLSTATSSTSTSKVTQRLYRVIIGSIADQDTDAIVNAANKELADGAGVCGAIYKKAGISALGRACAKLRPCATGDAVVTSAYKAPAKYIIHTVGPKWGEHNGLERGLLQKAYKTSMALAIKKKCTSIAFPILSGGIYNYPIEEAIEVGVDSVTQFVGTTLKEVRFVVLDRKIQDRISEELSSRDILHTLD